MRLGVFGFAMSGVQIAIFGYLAVYLVDERDVSPQVAGVALAFTLAAGGVGRVAWGILSDRLGARTSILGIVAVGSAISLAAVPLVSHGVPWPILGMVGICSVGWNGVYHALVAESAGPVGVARATAFAFAFLYSGSIIFPPLLGLAIETVSWTAFWWAGSCVVACSAVVVGWRSDATQVSQQSAGTAQPKD